MTEQVSEAVRKLRDVLDGAGRGLIGFDLDALLAAAPALHEAIGALQRAMAGVPAAPADVRTGPHPGSLAQDIEDARQALRRCERLGRALDDLTRISVSARNARLGLGYDRSGRERGPSTIAPSVEARA